MNLYVLPDPAGGSGIDVITIVDDINSNGDTILDSVEQSGSATITDHPVEVGPNVTDHVRADAVDVTYTWTVSDSPYQAGASGFAIQTTLELPVYTPPLASLSGLINAGLADLGAALFGAAGPPIVPGFALPPGYDAITDLHNALEAVRLSTSSCEIVTPTRTLESMKIKSVKVLHDEPGCAKFTVAFQQIFTATSATVDAPKPLQPRGAKSTSGGTQTPHEISETPKKSTILGGAVN